MRARLSWIVSRPYYVYRPSQVLRRAKLALTPSPASAKVALPWGLDLVVDPREALGAIVLRNAVYELAVSEVLYRLSDPGDLAVDVGANIGYMTSILADRTGPSGAVIACEPHPALFERLSRNVEEWKASSPALPSIKPMQIAVSDRGGTGHLSVPPEFALNMGTAGLANRPARDGIEVKLARLDELIPNGASVGVVKLDVEGHEARVLAGGERLLRDRRVRDIVFEELQGYPSEATSLLEVAGYEVFGIEQRLRRSVLTKPGEARPSQFGEPPNLLATSEPDRAISRLAPAGWRTLGRP